MEVMASNGFNFNFNFNSNSFKSPSTFKLKDKNLNVDLDIISIKLENEKYNHAKVFNYTYYNSIMEANSINNEDGNLGIYSFNVFENSNNIVEEWVVEMDNEYKIEKILLQNKRVHLSLFIFSIVMIICGNIPNLISKDISIIMKPMSIAFSLMIILNYKMRKLE